MTALFWEPSSRSPLTVLLAFLCFFANVIIDARTQPSARVYFGCFATAALITGIAVERRFMYDSVGDLDSLDLAPGVLSVLGAAMEHTMPQEMQLFVRYAVLTTTFLVSFILGLEYYNDGDWRSFIRWFKRRRNKKTTKAKSKYRGSKRSHYQHIEGTFQSKYEVGKRLGSGFFGTVVLAMDRAQKKTDDEFRCFAAKCVTKLKLSPDDELQIRNEIAILMEIRDQNPYIVNIYDFFDEPAHFFLVLELMRGGELFDRIVKKEKYFEKDARIVVKTLASALSFLHAQGIVHRDLKPENILMESEGSNSRIKLADFGFARKVEGGCLTACGTPNYVAPEIIDGSLYGVQVDIWALGVIMYILLSGHPPFSDPNRPKLFKQIRRGDYSLLTPHFRLVSREAKDLIRKCLTVDVKDRITADEILEHRWMSSQSSSWAKLRHFQNSERLDAEVPPAGTPELAAAHSGIKLFNARQRLRAGILAAIAANRMSAIVEVVKGIRADQEQGKMEPSVALKQKH